MKHLLLCLSIITLVQCSFAQVTYPISTYTPTPAAFRHLLLTNQQIEDNDTTNEEILDLVTPMVMDSILRRKKEHHQVFLLGWLIHAFGNYNWRAVDMVKQKIVGTVRGDGRSGEEEYTEYDINFDLYCHLHRYLWQVFKSFDKAGKISRQDIRATFKYHHYKGTDFNTTPYKRDTNKIDMYQYREHCELTPQREFRPMLNYLFYPTLPGIDMDRHPNFGNRYPSMGFYGATCLDCNHNCHPEMHPYEWIWWMNLHNGTIKDKTWLVGLLKDGSNRFHHWSHNPKTGKISIPFAYEVKDKDGKDRLITIEHLVFNFFIDSNLNKLNLPPTVFSTDQKSLEVKLTDDKGGVIPITVAFKNVMVHSGLRYWFSDVNWDEKDHIISGFINMATSVQDLYTMRVTFSGQ
jgi:hypothetical protein